MKVSSDGMYKCSTCDKRFYASPWRAKSVNSIYCSRQCYGDSMAEDLTGRRYGKWVVLRLAPGRASSNNTYWLCQCECGVISEVQKQSLVHGTSKQCAECAWRIVTYGNVPKSYVNLVRKRAVRRKMPFDVEGKDLEALYMQQEGRCALTGLSIGFHDQPMEGKSKSLWSSTASLDRIDSSVGYILDNVQWVHRDINAMKNLLNQNLFIYLCHRVASHNADCPEEEVRNLPGWMQKGSNKGIWNRKGENRSSGSHAILRAYDRTGEGCLPSESHGQMSLGL